METGTPNGREGTESILNVLSPQGLLFSRLSPGEAALLPTMPVWLPHLGTAFVNGLLKNILNGQK